MSGRSGGLGGFAYNLFLLGEQGSANAVNGSVTPALDTVSTLSAKSWIETHFVVEASCPVEVVEELGISFASPQVHIANFKVTPDCRRTFVNHRYL